MDRGGHYWDLGSQRHPALRERADPGSRGQSASRYPHARLGGERLHGPHGHPAGRPNGPYAGDRERPGTICGALHRHHAHTARGWRASVERDLRSEIALYWAASYLLTTHSRQLILSSRRDRMATHYKCLRCWKTTG